MRSFKVPRATSAVLAAVLGVAVPIAVRARPLPDVVAGRYVPNQVVVRLASGAPAPRFPVIGTIDQIGAVLLRVPAVGPALRTLRATPGVLSAQPNYIGTVAAAPPPSRANDPLFVGLSPSWDSGQWYMKRISSLWAWTIYPGAYYSARERPRNPLKVAVLDTWIDTTHRDWKNTGADSTSVTAGGQIDFADAKSFIAASKIQGDNMWHGTYVAGLIGAAADNSTDIAGIAYPSQIMPVTVASGDGTVNAFDLARGITWATDHNARIINVSLSIAAPDASGVDAVRSAVNRATSKGSLIVAAIGNNPNDDAEYPAGFSVENSGILAVGASDIFDQRDALCSKKGRFISVVAPDTFVWSLLPQDRNNASAPATMHDTCKTSISAAIVSGVAALVAGKNPSMPPADIAKRIEMTTDPIGAPGRNDETGYGRVNAEKAVWTGGGASMRWIALPTGGPSGSVTVTAEGPSSVTAAEIVVDNTPRGKGFHPSLKSGPNNSRRASMTINTSKLGEGPHEIYVRARDARGVWGPATTGVVTVDRSTPKAQMGSCYSTNDTVGQTVANPDDARQFVRFQFSDVWSRTLRVKIDLLDETFTSQATFNFGALPSGLYQIPWRDVEAKHGGSLTPGAYRIIMNVTNLVGLSDYTDTACMVLPTVRMVPSPGSSKGTGPIPAVSTRLPTALPQPTITLPVVPGTITPQPLPTGSTSPTPR